MRSVESKSSAVDVQTLQETMRVGIIGLALAKLRFDHIKRLKENLDVDAVAEAEKLFTAASETSLEDALSGVKPGRQVTRAAYAGLVLSGSDRFFSERITEWGERDDVRAFIGAPVTVRAAETNGAEPDMSFDETTRNFAHGSSIGGTITGLSIVHGGAIMLGDGEYVIDTNYEDSAGSFEEGSVTNMFAVHTNVAEARFTIESGLPG